MSFREHVLNRSQRIEQLLKALGGEGRGVHELVKSLPTPLDNFLARQLRHINHVRNNLVHEAGYTFNGDELELLRTCDDAISRLENVVQSQKTAAEAPTGSGNSSATAQSVQWYCTIDNLSRGPLSEAEFVALINQRVIKPKTLVWRQGLASWVAAASARPDLIQAIPAEIPATKRSYFPGCLAAACAALCLVVLPFTCSHKEQRGIWPFDRSIDVPNWGSVFIFTIIYSGAAYHFTKKD